MFSNVNPHSVVETWRFTFTYNLGTFPWRCCTHANDPYHVNRRWRKEKPRGKLFGITFPYQEYLVFHLPRTFPGSAEAMIHGSSPLYEPTRSVQTRRLSPGVQLGTITHVMKFWHKSSYSGRPAARLSYLVSTVICARFMMSRHNLLLLDEPLHGIKGPMLRLHTSTYRWIAQKWPSASWGDILVTEMQERSQLEISSPVRFPIDMTGISV